MSNLYPILPPCKTSGEWRDRLIAAYRGTMRHRCNGQIPSVETARKAVWRLQLLGLLPMLPPEYLERDQPQPQPTGGEQ